MDEIESVELSIFSNGLGKGEERKSVTITNIQQKSNLPATTDTSANVINEQDEPRSSNTSPELYPIDRGSRAWMFLAASFLTELICLGGAFSFSIFQDYLVQSPDSPLHKATNVDVSIIGTLLVCSTYLAPALMRGIWSHYAHWNRTMGLICIQLAGLSLLVASFGTSLPFLIIFMGLFPGILTGLGTLNYLIWLPQWFLKRRGLANGIAFAGAGTGGIVFPFMLNAALHSVGFGWTLRIWAGIIMIGGGLSALPIRPRITPPHSSSSFSIWTIFRPRTGEESNGRASQRKDKWRQWVEASAFLRTPLWITSAFATFVASMAFFCVSFYLAVYCSSLGVKSSTSTGIVAGFNGAALVGEIIVGHLCDRFAYPGVMLGIGLVGSLSAFLLFGLVHSLLGVVFFVLLYGGATGSWCSTWTPAAYDISRLKSMQTANVILSFTFVRGLAAAIGPLVAASLYNPQHNKDQAIFGAYGFDGLIIFVGCCMVTATICSPILSYLRRKNTFTALQEQF